eukprot:2685397-Pyramimonas_sp.AAC.1
MARRWPVQPRDALRSDRNRVRRHPSVATPPPLSRGAGGAQSQGAYLSRGCPCILRFLFWRSVLELVSLLNDRYDAAAALAPLRRILGACREGVQQGRRGNGRGR